MSIYRNRLERRDLVLAVITAVIGAAATVLAIVGVVVLTGFHL